MPLIQSEMDVPNAPVFTPSKSSGVRSGFLLKKMSFPRCPFLNYARSLTMSLPPAVSSDRSCSISGAMAAVVKNCSYRGRERTEQVLDLQRRHVPGHIGANHTPGAQGTGCEQIRDVGASQPQLRE